MPDDGKVLVGVRITPERRDEWKQFVSESSEFSTMASLMRVGVERTMSQEEGELATQVERMSNRLSTVAADLRDVDRNVDSLKEELNDVDEIAQEAAWQVDNLPEDDLRLSDLVAMVEGDGDA
jgi:hypothetical protein